MDDTGVEQRTLDCWKDYMDGVISSDSSFYGDDEHKAQLNERSDQFDTAEAWNSRRASLVDKALAQLAKERARGAANLFNPLQGHHCGRQLEESLDEFLLRLPPSTSIVSAELPWIRVANPYASRGDSVVGPLERLQDLCEAPLKHLEKQEGKPVHISNRAVDKMRSETVDQIQKHAIELNVKAGKWMLFIPSVNVDQIWRLIARAAIAGDLGISAKVAPHDLEGDPQGRRPRLICIYTKDFSNVEDVARVLSELKRLEMVASRGRIYYKLDAYTYLDIKAGNHYGIRPWIYSSSDVVISPK